jgi:hypothetical protein
VRIRRRRDDPTSSSGPPAVDEVADAEVTGDADATAGAKPSGPRDVSEVEEDLADDPAIVDLGALQVKLRQGVDLRLNTDPSSGAVIAVVFGVSDASVELRAFAAPRSGGSWEGVRAEIIAEFAKRGGTARERDGEYGPEVLAALPVTLPDGRQGAQPSRIVGIEGARWLLRATFLGKAAVAPDPDGVLESAVRDVVVVRGSEPMAPREPLPLRLPPNAQLEPAQQQPPQQIPPQQQGPPA